MSDWFDKIPIFIQLEKNIESGQDYCFKISPFSSSNSLSLWSKNKTHIGDLVNGQVCFTVIPEMIGDELLLASADPIDTSNTLFCLQQGNFRCSPNPTELVHAKSYQLSQPLSLNTDYTLSVEGAQDDWVGVWLGEDYFAGYLEDDCHSFAIDNLWKDTDFIRTEASTKYLSYDENIIDKINQAGQARLSINIKIVNANPTGNNRIGCELGVIWDDDVNGILHCWYYPTGGETYQGRISKGHTLSKKIKSIRYAFCTIETDGDVYEISQPKITVKDNVYWSPHPSDFSHIILKSLSPTTCISKAMLSRSSVRQDWLMAPEDIYRHSYSRNYILQSGRAVDFAEQGDIATTVQDFEGRNLIQGLHDVATSHKNGSWTKSVDRHKVNLAFEYDIQDMQPDSSDRNRVGFATSGIHVDTGNIFYAECWVTTDIQGRNRRNCILNYTNVESVSPPRIYFQSNPSKAEMWQIQGNEGEIDYPYQPAPEDLTHAKQYTLAEPLKLNTDYTLSVEGDLDDWTGVWLGDGYFAGYLKDEELGLECRNRQPYIASGNYVATTSATFFDNGSARLTRPGGNDISGSLQLKPSVLPFVSAGSYTFSYKTDDGRKIRLITRGYDENKNPVSVGITGGGTYISSYKGWYQTGEFSTTVTIDAPVKYLSFALMYTETDGGSVLVYQTQLEHGDTATPYTPNPADFDNIIIKSLTDTATIDRVMLSQSTTRQDWQPAPEDVQALLDKKADTDSLGDLAYDDLVELAKLGSTIISGGYLKTELLDATAINTQIIQIGSGTSFATGYDPSAKNRIFNSTPTTPYYVGDLWTQGSTGDIRRCKTARADGSYQAGDWEIASKYTDDTAVGTLSGSLKDMAFENTVELAKLGTTIIQGGYIKTDLLHIGSGSSYAAGYDPSKIPYIGANYFLESGVPVTSNQYLIKTYTPFTPLTEGRQYTITATVTPAAGVTHLAPVTSNGYHGLPNMAVTGTNKQTVSITFNMVYATGRKPSDNISNANVSIYRIPNDGSVTGNTTIHQIKVEEGGKATAWVPAAEDSTEKNQLAKNLGYTDYAAMMNQAAAGKTIISGGFINTQLLTADNIITGRMASANGKTYFDLDAAKILQQATVAGKDVRVEMSTAKPFSLQMKDALDRWQGYVYVTDASGYSGPNILVTSRYDINEDGVVDNEDVHILSKYMMKEDIAPGIPWPNGYPPFERMDLNSDGFVNTMDITMLIRESNHKPMIANIHNVLGIDSNGVWYSNDWGDTKKRVTNTLYGTPQTGWSNANGIRGFRSAEGIIYLSISLMAGTITTNTLVGTIGANLRPKYPIVVECYDFGYELLNNYKLVVLTNGDIRIGGASTFITGRRYEGACAYVAS